MELELLIRPGNTEDPFPNFSLLMVGPVRDETRRTVGVGR